MAEVKDKAPIGSIMEVSALDPEARGDPHPKLKALREACPVYRDQAGKAWMLTRYDDVRATVNDRSLWRGPSRAEKGAIVRGLDDGESARGEDSHSILFMDEPDHSRVRLPLAKAFYGRINAMKAEIEATIDSVLDRAPQSGRFDLISEIGIPVPILVIAKILGVEAERVDDFRTWSEDVILSLNPLRTPEEEARLERGNAALEAYFADAMADRRARPQDDLITDMVKLQADGADISDDEVRINLESLLIGGNLTTTDLIGNGVWLFLTHPEEMAKLKADPSLAGAAVEEILRYESPVGVTTRVVPDEREIGGCPMHGRHSVWFSLHAANRDPAAFDNPDAFNITREHVSHVAFGGGSHICIGAPLARLEARRVFEDIFTRYPNMTLPDQELTWRTLPFFRGLEALEVDV